MTKQAQYTGFAREIFSQYLDKQIDLDVLITRLRDMELQVMSDADDEEEEETGKRLWFRFFEGDTLATTISDIEKDLADTSHPNADILLRGITFGLQTDELEVHYS
ncbi:hypothetical protein [Pontibacter roseus]|uniref:hypothetical protein n=1 Tax=Pontibacter roseus TaxID=336989 RepID=UPI000379A641|nr:hypothetical protein [Pontibacter roseus]